MFSAGNKLAQLLGMAKPVNALVLSICLSVVISVLLLLQYEGWVFLALLVPRVLTLALFLPILVGHKTSCPTLARKSEKNYSYFLRFFHGFHSHGCSGADVSETGSACFAASSALTSSETASKFAVT
jgi:hypothetical protein